MFTKQDFIGYYNQILDIEKKMEDSYQHLYDQIAHPEYRRLFEQLVYEERLHQDKVAEIINLFK